MSRRPSSSGVSAPANRVAYFRARSKLSQADLARLAGVSRQQIARIEKGQDTRLQIALAIARALERPIDLVFPSLADAPTGTPRPGPVSNAGDEAFSNALGGPEWAAGSEHRKAAIPDRLVPAYLRFEIARFDKPLVYPVAPADSRHVWSVLSGSGSRARGFVAFGSRLRRVFVNVRDIQSVTFVEEPLPPPAHVIEPGSGNLRIWLRGRSEPWIANGLELDRDTLDIGVRLEGACDEIERRFVQISDEKGQIFVFNAAEVVLVELPTEALLEEIRALPPDDPYFAPPPEKLRFEGRILPEAERADIVSAMALAADTALRRHVEERLQWTYEPPGAELLEVGLQEVVERLRRHGYSIRRGDASASWALGTHRYRSLADELLDAFCDGMDRALQHGAQAWPGADLLSRDMLRVIVFSGLSSLKSQGYRIAPGDRWVAWDLDEDE